MRIAKACALAAALALAISGCGQTGQTKTADAPKKDTTPKAEKTVDQTAFYVGSIKHIENLGTPVNLNDQAEVTVDSVEKVDKIPQDKVIGGDIVPKDGQSLWKVGFTWKNLGELSDKTCALRIPFQAYDVDGKMLEFRPASRVDGIDGTAPVRPGDMGKCTLVFIGTKKDLGWVVVQQTDNSSGNTLVVLHKPEYKDKVLKWQKKHDLF